LDALLCRTTSLQAAKVGERDRAAAQTPHPCLATGRHRPAQQRPARVCAGDTLVVEHGGASKHQCVRAPRHRPWRVLRQLWYNDFDIISPSLFFARLNEHRCHRAMLCGLCDAARFLALFCAELCSFGGVVSKTECQATTLNGTGPSTSRGWPTPPAGRRRLLAPSLRRASAPRTG